MSNDNLQQDNSPSPQPPSKKKTDKGHKTIEDKKLRLKVIEVELKTLWQQQDKVNKSIFAYQDKQSKLRDEIDEIELDPDTDWSKLLKVNESGDQTKPARKLLEKKIKSFFDKDYYVSLGTYNPETKQSSISISSYGFHEKKLEAKKKHKEGTKAFLKDVLPHIKKMKDEGWRGIDELNEYKYIYISTDDCSASGVLHLRINEDKNFFGFCKTTYGSTRLIRKYSGVDEFVDDFFKN